MNKEQRLNNLRREIAQYDEEIRDAYRLHIRLIEERDALVREYTQLMEEVKNG